ncbi:MAG: hypothetical protein MUF64_03110 [Polyangiaceae bacterium]|jgi:hypothetical protein|nr:hypothetical protein [Polyangiaceae bacterium]
MAISQVQHLLGRWLTDQGHRVDTMLGEYARLEQQRAEQARRLLEEWARLTGASMSYGVELNAQWRKLSMELTRRAVELVTPRS